jgi:hypothetical protein
MRHIALTLLLATTLCMDPGRASAEKWVRFHTESWHHDSQKLKKKLRFSSTAFYDSDSISVAANGDVTVWIRDVSHNDRYYVGKGIPEKEVVHKQIRLRCSVRKYDVLLGDEEDGLQEAVSEEISSGSIYDKLYKRVCKQVK